MATSTDPQAIYIAIDIGTTYHKAAFVLWYDDMQKVPLSSVIIVKFDRRATSESRAPAILHLARNKDSPPTWGHDLQRNLERGTVQEKDIFKLAKVALHKCTQTVDIEAHTDALLLAKGGMTHEDLWTINLQCLINEVKAAVRDWARTERLQQDPANWLPDEQQWHIAITTPTMWGEKENDVLEDAAERLHQRIYLIDEAASAGMYVVRKSLDDPSQRGSIMNMIQSEHGYSMLIADIGGGTTDATLLRFHKQADGNIGYRQIGSTRGIMAGSSFLNRRLEKYLRDSYRSPEGNGKDITTKLGYNLEELMAIMDAKFEEAKTSGIGFVLGKPLRLIVDCKSVSGVKQELEEHTFKVEWKLVERFYHDDCRVGDILDLIDEMTSRVKGKIHIVIPGPFGRDKFLQRSIENHLKHERISLYKDWTDGEERGRHSVAIGALYEFSSVLKAKSETTVTEELNRWVFGVTQDELFDETMHHDAVGHPRLLKGEYAINRVLWFNVDCQHGDSCPQHESNPLQGNSAILEWKIARDQEWFEQVILATKRENAQQHESLFTPSGRNREARDHIKVQVHLKERLPNIQALGYRATKSMFESRRAYYNISTRFKIETVEGGVKNISVEFMRNPRSKARNARNADAAGTAGDVRVRKLVDPAHFSVVHGRAVRVPALRGQQSAAGGGQGVAEGEPLDVQESSDEVDVVFPDDESDRYDGEFEGSDASWSAEEDEE